MQPRRDRYFDFVYGEICVAIGRRISRYDLWLLVSETGANPSELSRDQVQGFIDQGLDLAIAREKKLLSPRAQQRLHRRLLDFDPRHPTPEEWLSTIGGTTS
jgi:hypothetical protein